MIPSSNPCVTCGACCAHFRVSFHWGEADPAQGGTVPPDLTDDLPPFRRCMRGTTNPPIRCVALTGEIGQEVHCAIYADRSTTCREFGVDWVDGQWVVLPGELERCNHARAFWGLQPLDLPPARGKRRVPDYRLMLLFRPGTRHPRPQRPPTVA